MQLCTSFCSSSWSNLTWQNTKHYKTWKRKHRSLPCYILSVTVHATTHKPKVQSASKCTPPLTHALQIGHACCALCIYPWGDYIVSWYVSPNLYCMAWYVSPNLYCMAFFSRSYCNYHIYMSASILPPFPVVSCHLVVLDCNIYISFGCTGLLHIYIILLYWTATLQAIGYSTWLLGLLHVKANLHPSSPHPNNRLAFIMVMHSTTWKPPGPHSDQLCPHVVSLLWASRGRLSKTHEGLLLLHHTVPRCI